MRPDPLRKPQSAFRTRKFRIETARFKGLGKAGARLMPAIRFAGSPGVQAPRRLPRTGSDAQSRLPPSP